MNPSSITHTIKFHRQKWRNSLHKLVFQDDTIEGKMFNTALMCLILLSIIVVMLQSVHSLNQKYGTYMLSIEMFISFIFGIEYIARIVAHPQPHKFIFSTRGILDFIAFAPCYFAWVYFGSNYFLLLRVARILHIFQVFELNHYSGQVQALAEALGASRPKIIVFIVFVASVVIIIGFLMYLIEGAQNAGFSSIPKSIYWAIVTLTTVGYGDIAPTTALGRVLASLVMLMGYGVIAVPTGIVSAEIVSHSQEHDEEELRKVLCCLHCGEETHDVKAHFCHNCGSKLNK